MALLIEHGNLIVATDFRDIGHGCQVAQSGVHWAMDPAFREAFPSMYDTWVDLCRRGELRPGDQVASEGTGDRAVHTLGIKESMSDSVDLDALTGALQATLDGVVAEAVAFHRLGTRCQGRLPWDVVRPVLEASATPHRPDVVIFVDPWDDLVDEIGIGAELEATVTAVRPYGAFIEFGSPFGGFIDVLSLSPTHVLEVGQVLEVEVLGLEDAHGQVRFMPVDDDRRSADHQARPV